MCLFRRKKSVTEKNSDNRKIIERNAKALSNIISLYGNKLSEETLNELEELKSLVEYFLPSPKESVVKIDKKISDVMDDLNILTSKEEVDENKFKKYILEIKRLIASRNLEV